MKRLDIKRERQLFEKLVAHPEKRAALLDALGPGDVRLRHRLERLLRAHGQSGFLDQSPVRSPLD